MTTHLLTTLPDEGAVQIACEALGELGIPAEVRTRRSHDTLSLVAVQGFDLLVPEERLEEARAALDGLFPEEGDGTPGGAIAGDPEALGALTGDWAARRRHRFLLAIGLLVLLSVLLFLI